MTDLLEVPASELRPGDRVTFGDHTGWYRVRCVTDIGTPHRLIEDQVRVVAWPRRFEGRIEWRPLRVVDADETVWVKR